MYTLNLYDVIVNYISMKLEKRVQCSQIGIESSKSNFVFLDYGTPLYSSANSHSILTMSVTDVISTWILCCPSFPALPLESYTSLTHWLQPWSCDLSAIEIWEKVMCIVLRRVLEIITWCHFFFSLSTRPAVSQLRLFWVWVLKWRYIEAELKQTHDGHRAWTRNKCALL